MCTIIEYNLSLIPVVIIVVQLFDRAFLFQCLLCNHSYKTNPNSNILTYTFLLCLYISLLHYKTLLNQVFFIAFPNCAVCRDGVVTSNQLDFYTIPFKNWCNARRRCCSKAKSSFATCVPAASPFVLFALFCMV